MKATDCLRATLSVHAEPANAELLHMLDNLAYGVDEYTASLNEAACDMERVAQNIRSGNFYGAADPGLSQRASSYVAKRQLYMDFLLDALRVVNREAPKTFLRLLRGETQ